MILILEEASSVYLAATGFDSIQLVRTFRGPLFRAPLIKLTIMLYFSLIYKQHFAK